MIEFKGQDVVGSEPVRDRGIQVIEIICSAYRFSFFVLSVYNIDDRSEYGIEPASAESYVELGPVPDYRPLEPDTAVDKSEHEITVIPVEISVTCGNIRYGTHSGAVSGGKSALVEIQMIYYISVER